MDTFRVEELMVPLAEYATISSGSTLHEAVLALEKSQEEFDQSKYRHRSILVLNRKGRVIGRLNHLDALKALIPEHDGHLGTDRLGKFGFSNSFIRKLHQQRLQRAIPLDQLCTNAKAFKVEDYMRSHKESEFIDYQADITTAIHQLIQENLRSLLVSRQDEIIGILRLTDIFSIIYHTMARPEVA